MGDPDLCKPHTRLKIPRGLLGFAPDESEFPTANSHPTTKLSVGSKTPELSANSQHDRLGRLGRNSKHLMPSLLLLFFLLTSHMSLEYTAYPLCSSLFVMRRHNMPAAEVAPLTLSFVFCTNPVLNISPATLLQCFVVSICEETR